MINTLTGSTEDVVCPQLGKRSKKRLKAEIQRGLAPLPLQPKTNYKHVPFITKPAVPCLPCSRLELAALCVALSHMSPPQTAAFTSLEPGHCGPPTTTCVFHHPTSLPESGHPRTQPPIDALSAPGTRLGNHASHGTETLELSAQVDSQTALPTAGRCGHEAHTFMCSKDHCVASLYPGTGLPL
ncbi:hypothetical protein NDU88_003207 [Pleurodeles waltl]|uniref:Uncharacterized protein n=1 Tax=Pleurodeles waltl TaxID=8319 RepID=A0AAV7VCQ4_PLEWA|nr:hypothetical protein NDU88_003207 [Pleurodeles waltl]